MAGSRAEKVGSIFSRVQGLLRAGALKEIDKPIWYNVYAAFPPMEEPKYERRITNVDPTNILYKEDFIRAQFYKTYGTPDVIDMTDNAPSVSQRFVEKYMQLEGATGGDEDTFESAAAALRQEGVALKTLAEMKQEQEAGRNERAARAREQQEQRQRGKLNVSVRDMFGDTVTAEQTEEADFVDEDVLDPHDKSDK